MLHTHRDDASKRRQLRSVTVAVTTSRIVTELFFFGVPSFTEFFCACSSYRRFSLITSVRGTKRAFLLFSSVTVSELKSSFLEAAYLVLPSFFWCDPASEGFFDNFCTLH